MTTDTRQQLYDRIRESSMDEVILEEMIRYGFWPSEQEIPSLPAELIKRRGELQREVTELAKKASAYNDPEKAIQQIMKQRMKLAREKRIETKEKQAQQRYDRAMAWDKRKRNDVVFLGADVSAPLKNREVNKERLAKLGLPIFEDMQAIADAMGVKLGELRFLSFDRKVSKVSHYFNFKIPKKTGGFRYLSAPMPRLKRVQYWLLDNILMKLDVHEAAHGFHPGRSILTNARPHVGKAVVINLDLKDFFPTIGYKRVKGLFHSLGYSEAEAAIFALLTTEAKQSQLELDGQTWHVDATPRVLPQGAPTSPAITNLICRKLDQRLTGAAKKHAMTYTRYADDLTFSSTHDDKKAIGQFMRLIRLIIKEEGFVINENKTRIMRQNGRQEVTGLTVNSELGISRQERRKFRAYLHNNKNNPNPPSWRTGSAKASALGYAQFLQMVLGKKAQSLTAQTTTLFGKTDQTMPPKPLGRKNMRTMAAIGKPAKTEWWEPETPPLPKLEKVPTSTKGKDIQSLAPTSVPEMGRERVVIEDRASRKGMNIILRMFITFITVLVGAAIPGGFLLAGFVIYWLWFRK